MRLLQAREEAKNMKVKENEWIIFELIGPEERRVKCKWLDPHLGLFMVEGESGFRMVDDFQQRDMQVQNTKVEAQYE